MSLLDGNCGWLSFCNAAAVFTSIPADFCRFAVSYDGDSIVVLYMTHSGHPALVQTRTSYYASDAALRYSRVQPVGRWPLSVSRLL